MAAPRPRAGRPRDEDATARVLAATVQLLDRQGFAALRIDDVAHLSGVAKTTIYRRWPSLIALVLAAMESALGPRSLPESGDVEADLTALIRMVYRSITQTPFVRALPLVSIELMQHPELSVQYRERIIDPVRTRAVRLVRAGMEQGLFRPDADPTLVVDLVISPLMFRQVVLHEELSLADLLAIGELVLRSIRIHPPGDVPRAAQPSVPRP